MRGVVALIGALLVGCYHVGQLAHVLSARREAGAPALYADRCSSCHGDGGRGDGLAGRSLDPHPRDFGDRRWQSATSDERIRFVIRNGGRAAGLSASMAPHAELTDTQLDELVAWIRSVSSDVSSAPAARTARPR